MDRLRPPNFSRRPLPEITITRTRINSANSLDANNMATTAAAEAKASQAPSSRRCIICTEYPGPEAILIQPCRSCNSDYCDECLTSMFYAAITDNNRMPPRCCNLIQIHTVLQPELLSPEESKAYRAKFEEWITPAKTYCPAPACSTFIPERKIPSKSVIEAPTLTSVLTDILDDLSKSSPSRFCRGSLDTSVLPGYNTYVSNHIDLVIVRKRLQSSEYKTTDAFTSDMKLIVKNAKSYNGEKHPVARAAEEFFDRYLHELAKAMDRLLKSTATSESTAMFACPSCHIGICVSCKQIEHSGSPCDTSAQDHEMAMLETFGYKRCPRCKAGVKKMYGCSHMQCVCGAHWCYYCQRSINLCDGTCEERLDEEDFSDEDEYFIEDDGGDGEDEDSEEGEVRAAGPAPTTMTRPAATAATRPWPPARPAQPSEETPVDLDAGGSRRWAEEGMDFGEEPEDEGVAQVWSCYHNFDPYKAPPDDGINRGDLDQMECNRCFEHVEIKKPEPKSTSKKRKRFGNQSFAPSGTRDTPIVVKDDSPVPTTDDKTAHECRKCKVVVCVGCKAKYEAAREEEE